MKKVLTIIVISLLCVSAFSILTPKVMGWAFLLHGAMANDALTGMGWSNQVGTYANDVDLYFPHPGSSNHRVGKYQVLYQNLGGDPCNYQGAEYWARIYIASARNSYLSNNMADAEMYLGYAIHYIEDAVCPPHVFPFSEEFIWWAPLSWQLVSLKTAPHANFEAETLVGYGIKNWPLLVRNAEPALIADLSDLETKIVQAADRVYALPCDYVRQNDHPIADDNDVVGDPSHVTGWSMLDENIGKCMVEAASLVKGAAIYVRVGAGGVPPEVVCVPFHGMLLGVPHDAWIGKEIILKGTAHDPDGDSTLAAYKWDFGDGYSTNWIAGVNAYVIEARHTYTGAMADGTPYGAGKYFTAWLHVKDNEGLEGKDSYFIAIREKTLDVEVNLAIDNGLWWLHKQQVRGNYPDGEEYGYWNSPYGYYVASTSACTEAFELQGHLPSGDLGEDPYVETVQRGLNYLFNQFHTHSVYQDATYCPLGNPDTNGNGIGLGCYGPGEILYESGMALMTVSSSGSPNKIAATGSVNVVGRAYKDIVQDMIDWFAWGQNDPIAGVYEGGWRYQANYEQGGSDNSVSQWPVIGLEAAERNFGSAITVPSFVRPELAKWLSYSQNPSGGFGYSGPGEWVNTAKTGAGCAMLSWIGVPTTDARFQNALSFLDAYWYYSGSSYTNFGDYYTMYAIMKGMRIPNPNIVFIGSHDWYAEYARYIVDEQNNYGDEYVVDHSWLGGYISAEHATGWGLATLTLTVTTPGPVAEAGFSVNNFPPTIPVKFDASGSYHRDPTRSIVLYEWDFDSDGTWDYSGTNSKVEHAYPAYTNPDGSIDWDETTQDYTATLRVSDNSGPALQDTDTCIVHITPPPWKPVADPDGPYEGSEGVAIQLDGSKSYDPESKMYSSDHPWYETIAEYEWDLDNDGQFDDSVDVKPSHTWSDAGAYSVGLKVTDSQASGSGGAVGPLDVDIRYTTVVIKVTSPIADVAEETISNNRQSADGNGDGSPDYGWTTGYDISFTSQTLHIEIDIQLVGDDPGDILRQTWHDGIENIWSNAYDIVDGPYTYQIEVGVNWVTSNPHHTVTVHAGAGRANMLNWYTDTSAWGPNHDDEIVAHEAGHMMGVYDEYAEPFVDQNNNLRYDSGEPFTDAYNPPNGRWDCGALDPNTWLMHTGSLMDTLGPTRSWHYEEILQWLEGKSGRDLTLAQSPLPPYPYSDPVVNFVDPFDSTSPTTILKIGNPKYTDPSSNVFVTSDTPFTLEATDTSSGVKSTVYKITDSASYDSGWLTYTGPFKLTSLRDGNYTIAFNSTDNVGNVENTNITDIVLVGPDINGDGKADMKDIVIAINAFRSFPGHPRWNPIADINFDGLVDMRDIVYIAMMFGKHWP